MKSKFLIFIFCLSIAACRNSARQDTLQKQYIEIDGKTREYIIYIPGRLQVKPPLVVALHGYTDNDSAFMNYTGLNRVAKKNGFAVCYPQGLIDSTGKTFWQVGYSFHRNEKVNDVRFISMLTEYLQKAYEFDPERTFVTGMSNGGDLCILLACKKPGIFKAAAPVVGCMMKVVYDSCSSSTPIPVFMINGTKDKTTWWAGDLDDDQHYGPYFPALATFDFFAGKNKCTVLTSDTLPDINKSDSSYIIAKKYSGGFNGNQVWLYTVVGGGHNWTGKEGNMDLNASEEIWNFFKLTGNPQNNN